MLKTISTQKRAPSKEPGVKEAVRIAEEKVFDLTSDSKGVISLSPKKLSAIFEQMASYLVREDSGLISGALEDIQIIVPAVAGLVLPFSGGNKLTLGSIVGYGNEGIVYKASTEDGEVVACKLSWPFEKEEPERYSFSQSIHRANYLAEFLSSDKTTLPEGTGVPKFVAQSFILSPAGSHVINVRVTEFIHGRNLSDIFGERGSSAGKSALECFHKCIELTHALGDRYKIECKDIGLRNFTWENSGRILFHDLGECDKLEGNSSVPRTLHNLWSDVLSKIPTRMLDDSDFEQFKAFLEILGTGQFPKLKPNMQ